jgi:hypothetical protein
MLNNMGTTRESCFILRNSCVQGVLMHWSGCLEKFILNYRMFLKWLQVKWEDRTIDGVQVLSYHIQLYMERADVHKHDMSINKLPLLYVNENIIIWMISSIQHLAVIPYQRFESPIDCNNKALFYFQHFTYCSLLSCTLLSVLKILNQMCSFNLL